MLKKFYNYLIIILNCKRGFRMSKTSIKNNENFHYKTVDKTCYGANIIYLLIHIFYLVLFIVSKVDVMIYVDIVAITIYLLSFILLKTNRYYLYALLCGNVFLIFVSFATINVGFNSGFHLYLIGLSVVSFFTTYFSKNRNLRGSLIWAILSLIIYLTLFFVTRFNPPHYIIDSWMETTLFALHAVMAFAFVAVYLSIFLGYASKLESKIKYQSRTDELTQINNRYALSDYFEKEDDKTKLFLSLFDIDDFKKINDEYGHVTGDYILKEVANIATETLQDSFVCRYGGEEFVIVSKAENSYALFDKLEVLRKKIENTPFEFNKVKINITITIGVSNYLKGFSLEKLVELADEKMYQGKKEGKNRTII